MMRVIRLLVLGALLLPSACAAPQKDAPAEPPAGQAESPASADAPPSSEREFVSPIADRYFGDYARAVRQRIEDLYVRAVREEYDGGYGRASVSFLVQPDGSVADLVVTQASGDVRFEDLCRAVVLTAEPFGPVPYASAKNLPRQYKNEPIAFRLEFEFAPDTPPDEWADGAAFPPGEQQR